jgi:hypothetical protein
MDLIADRSMRGAWAIYVLIMHVALARSFDIPKVAVYQLRDYSNPIIQRSICHKLHSQRINGVG